MKVRLSDTALFENQADERLREREIGTAQADFRPKNLKFYPTYHYVVYYVLCVLRRIFKMAIKSGIDGSRFKEFG